MSDTPRTDMETWNVDAIHIGDEQFVVNATFAKELEREAAQLRAELDNAHSKLAGLADCVNAAHRNTNMPDPLFTDYSGGDMRELIWALSYKANSNRTALDTLRADNAALAGALREVLEVFVKPHNETLWEVVNAKQALNQHGGEK